MDLEAIIETVEEGILQIAVSVADSLEHKLYRRDALLGSSSTYRMATGPSEGRNELTLPIEPDAPRPVVAESCGLLRPAAIAATGTICAGSLPDRRLTLKRGDSRPERPRPRAA
jgi:hypothetical protein